MVGAVIEPKPLSLTLCNKKLPKEMISIIFYLFQVALLTITITINVSKTQRMGILPMDQNN